MDTKAYSRFDKENHGGALPVPQTACHPRPRAPDPRDPMGSTLSPFQSNHMWCGSV